MSLGSLAYADCVKCEDETLHRSGLCIHCGDGAVLHERKRCPVCFGEILPPSRAWRDPQKFCSRRCAVLGLKARR